MNAQEFKAARRALGLNQVGAAFKFGVDRRTIIRWEDGSSPIPANVTFSVELMSHVTSGEPEKVTSENEPTPIVTSSGLDLSKLTPWTVPNIPGRDWFPLDETKWQRCGYRVVSALIPEPIPYEAPKWAGWRAILTRSGRVFDYETGREMKPLQTFRRPEPPTPGSRQIEKKRRLP